MCLDNYIGIRGECNIESKLYLDDLPGIDIVKASNFTSETLLRPINLVTKCFNQAKKEVLQDILSLIKSRQYNHIVQSNSFQFAGNYEYFGLINEFVKIKINKRNIDFIKLHVNGFELISDRNITKDFVISDGNGIQDVITVELQVGKNKIPLDQYSSSEYISISFDLIDFKLGIKENNNYFYSNYSCRPCFVTASCDCSYTEIYFDDVLSSKEIGFNLVARCEADECALLEYITPICDLALLYKTGINYLLEVKMSGRINAYLRNTESALEEILTLWMGGYDNAADTKVPSMYWQKVKQITRQIENSLININSPIFTHDGSYVCDQLP